VFSLAMRLAISFSLIASGWFLSGVGYQVPKDGQYKSNTKAIQKDSPFVENSSCHPLGVL
jgi:hypothetical protein